MVIPPLTYCTLKQELFFLNHVQQRAKIISVNFPGRRKRNILQALCNLNLCLFKIVVLQKNRRLSLTEVTVVELAWLDPDGGAGAEVDAQTDHVVQLKV